jgi:hypothetical protein
MWKIYYLSSSYIGVTTQKMYTVWLNATVETSDFLIIKPAATNHIVCQI